MIDWRITGMVSRGGVVFLDGGEYEVYISLTFFGGGAIAQSSLLLRFLGEVVMGVFFVFDVEELVLLFISSYMTLHLIVVSSFCSNGC